MGIYKYLRFTTLRTRFGAKHLNQPRTTNFLEICRKLKETTKCDYCGEDVVLPFKCAYCGGFFCAEHRLPESHECPEAWRAKAPRDAPPARGQGSKEPAYKYTVSYTPQTAKAYGFSIKELQHLAIGALLVMGVGFTYFLTSGVNLLGVLILSVAFMSSFLLHELAHKFSAQHFNMWAEFRLTLQGALITLVSMFLPFKIISPGAVMISGSATRETVGKTSLAGPVTNIILSLLCILFASMGMSLFQIVAFINAFLAVFNLVPFGVMDGLKVFRWNKILWAAAFTVAAVLTFFTY